MKILLTFGLLSYEPLVVLSCTHPLVDVLRSLKTYRYTGTLYSVHGTVETKHLQHSWLSFLSSFFSLFSLFVCFFLFLHHIWVNFLFVSFLIFFYWKLLTRTVFARQKVNCILIHKKWTLFLWSKLLYTNTVTLQLIKQR